jgi:hypothetical protein
MTNDFTTAFVSDQPSGDCGGVVEQPAKKNAVAKIIPANLNTHQFCGTEMRTQDVSGATCLRREVRA